MNKESTVKTIQVTEIERQIIATVLDNFADGAGIQAIRNAIKIIDKVESSGGNLELEDSEYAFLVQRFNATRFLRADRNVVGLFEKLEKA